MGATSLRKPHRGKEPSIEEIAAKASHRFAVTAPREVALKLAIAANAAGSSCSGLLIDLIEQMEVDEAGLPSWADDPAEGGFPELRAG